MKLAGSVTDTVCLDKWPGPLWEPIVHDGIFPLTAEPGDIYINRYREPPLYYIFTTKNACEPIDREELKAWVTGGLMKVSPLVPTKSKVGPKSSKDSPTVLD